MKPIQMKYDVYVGLTVIMKTGMECILAFFEAGHDSPVVMEQLSNIEGSGPIALNTMENFKFVNNRDPVNDDVIFFDFEEKYVIGMKWLANELKETAVETLADATAKNDEKSIVECNDMIEMTTKVLECFENQS